MHTKDWLRLTGQSVFSPGGADQRPPGPRYYADRGLPMPPGYRRALRPASALGYKPTAAPSVTKQQRRRQLAAVATSNAQRRAQLAAVLRNGGVAPDDQPIPMWRFYQAGSDAAALHHRRHAELQRMRDAMG